mmetsp:Transcript_1480/g.5074  ORF Transcript_1480/g.5074 Transcript_1480/m.5074 type:complete len:313 (-) Transcript_1480:85-1023(-)
MCRRSRRRLRHDRRRQQEERNEHGDGVRGFGRTRANCGHFGIKSVGVVEGRRGRELVVAVLPQVPPRRRRRGRRRPRRERPLPARGIFSSRSGRPGKKSRRRAFRRVPATPGLHDRRRPERDAGASGPRGLRRRYARRRRLEGVAPRHYRGRRVLSSGLCVLTARQERVPRRDADHTGRRILGPRSSERRGGVRLLLHLHVKRADSLRGRCPKSQVPRPRRRRHPFSAFKAVRAQAPGRRRRDGRRLRTGHFLRPLLRAPRLRPGPRTAQGRPPPAPRSDLDRTEPRLRRRRPLPQEARRAPPQHDQARRRR